MDLEMEQGHIMCWGLIRWEQNLKVHGMDWIALETLHCYPKNVFLKVSLTDQDGPDYPELVKSQKLSRVGHV